MVRRAGGGRWGAGRRGCTWEIWEGGFDVARAVIGARWTHCEGSLEIGWRVCHSRRQRARIAVRIAGLEDCRENWVGWGCMFVGEVAQRRVPMSAGRWTSWRLRRDGACRLSDSS